MIFRSMTDDLGGHKYLWAGLGLVLLAILVAYHVAFRANSQSPANEKQMVPALAKSTPQREGSPSGAAIANFEIEKSCFSRDDYVYMANIKTGVVKRILKGDEPNLSSGGNEIAFTDVQESPGKSRSTIKVLELGSGAVREFSSLSEVNSYGPQWSPDGRRIAFEYKTGFNWGVGILDTSSNQWKDLTKKLPTEDFFLSSWVPDGKSVLCQNLEQIYELDLEGNELQRIPIERIISRAKGGISSRTKFSFSPDKNYLLFDTTVAPEENGGIFVFDMQKQTLARVTPDTIDASEPKWLPAEKEVLFLQLTRREVPYEFSISKIALDGTNLQILIRNARNVSYSR